MAFDARPQPCLSMIVGLPDSIRVMARQAERGRLLKQNEWMGGGMGMMARGATVHGDWSVYVSPCSRRILVATATQALFRRAGDAAALWIMATAAAVLPVRGVGEQRNRRPACAFAAGRVRHRQRALRNGVALHRRRARIRNAIEEKRQHAMTRLFRAGRGRHRRDRDAAQNDHRASRPHDTPPRILPIAFATGRHLSRRRDSCCFRCPRISLRRPPRPALHPCLPARAATHSQSARSPGRA